ncbi:competence protein CoiA [Liquorilactobacillus oeni]|uniref:Competence protein transcription factor n=1 Tax=Liquorilactobacillus oeni DSM 19972 TaxID=1423777 RepID=A0A0R1M9M1_9LACO|nr:competence protein CoiA family protein [Liquorilactobacillus oeni]KRL04796.1 competence protein transcription factor [Liquorilactobacillus oeni DSM 19972]
MLLALSADGKLVNAVLAQENEYYRCPACHTELILKRGNVKVAHFAHKSKLCSFFTEGETVEHLNGKIQLTRIFERESALVNLECYLDAIKQRPDLLVQKKIELAVEFQCAPLSVKKMVQRSKGYAQKNIRFIWILGERHRLKKRMTQQIAQFIKWLPNIGFYLIYYSVKLRRLELFYQIQQADYLQPFYLCYATKSFSDLLSFMKRPYKIMYRNLNAKQRSIQIIKFQQECYYGSGKIRELQADWYSQGVFFQQLEFFFIQKKYGPPIYSTKQMYWKSRYLLHRYSEKKDIQLQQIGLSIQNENLFLMPFVNLSPFLKEQLVDFNSHLYENKWFFKK